jgi:aminomethyltransferase
MTLTDLMPKRRHSASRAFRACHNTSLGVRAVTRTTASARGVSGFVQRLALPLFLRKILGAGGFSVPQQATAGAGMVEIDKIAELASALREENDSNNRWRRRECVNLIPSEQVTSAYVDSLCVSDPSGRYNEHTRLKSMGPDEPDLRYYQGTTFIMEKEEELKDALRTCFGCARVEPRIVSGQMANDTVYDALKQFRTGQAPVQRPRPIRRALVHDLRNGGHLSAQPLGALRNYIDIDPDTGAPAVDHFPFQPENPQRIDIEGTKRIIAEKRPELLVFGRSVMVHKDPVKDIAEFIHAEFGRNDPQRPLIMYDASHVFGLLGEYFQDPLKEGADIVTGSTHKTFFGPQRGVILSNIEPGSPFEELWRFVEARAFPGHVSNHHLGTMLGLLGATYEMLRYRDDYPKRVIANAKAFAAALSDQGLKLEGDPQVGYTETHQVLLRTEPGQGGRLAELLEANNVITNRQAYYDDPGFSAASGVRTGTQEMTRYGMKPEDFETLAGLVAEVSHSGADRPSGFLRDEVKSFRAGFTDIHYCF